MKKLNDLEYLKLNKLQALWYNLQLFFCAIPGRFKKLGLSILNFFKNCGLGVKNEVLDIGTTFTKGNWAVKLSFLFFGMGNLFYGQIARGILFFLFEVIFIAYMLIPNGGIHWLSKGHWNNMFADPKTTPLEQLTLGTDGPVKSYDPIFDQYVTNYGDDSVKVMLYGLLTILFIIAFIYTWRLQIKQCRINMDIVASGRRIKSAKDDLRSLVDDQFHKTMLALPLGGILFFTVLPTIYMVLIPLTSYDAEHNGYANKLFNWVGFEHFEELTNFGKGGMGAAFGEIISWTLMWAFFATFTNYFLGMFVAIMINKKGIKIKKFWRTVLVMTIAIPQFVSLLYVKNLFTSSGIIGKQLLNWNLIPEFMQAQSQLDLWANPITSKILLVVINIWVGIPYIMLMATGILMNIPQDLYESARIDGASGVQQYTKITLPYMMFVMGPYLLTSFVGNLNNFNIIYLLSGGGPANTEIGYAGGVSIGHTDLLITWLYRMTLESPQTQYYYASMIGILVFVFVAALSLVVYNLIPSTKNEEDYR